MRAKKILEKKVKPKKMNNKLKVTMKVIGNVDCKYLDTKIYIEENPKGKT